MNNDNPAKSYGLLACGHRGSWDISLLQPLGSHATPYFLELDSGDAYLIFQLDRLDLLRDSLVLLESPVVAAGGKALRMGVFNDLPMELVRDSEFADRCTLRISDANCPLIITISGSAFSDFLAALRQLIAEM